MNSGCSQKNHFAFWLNLFQFGVLGKSMLSTSRRKGRKNTQATTKINEEESKNAKNA
jgi:hypothetical protein